MEKVIIIGGGFAGLISAINIKNDFNEVIILEKNKEVGSKILVTGSGKCNYYNEDISLDKYHSNTNLLEYIDLFELAKTKDFYSSLGIIPYIRNGYYYPITKDSKTIRDTLYNECISKGIKIISNFEVTDIKQNNNQYEVIGNDKLICDYLIISTGSKAYYKETNTYNLLSKLNLKVIKPLPALVQLETKDKSYLKEWHGIRSEVKVSLFENNKFIKEELGEIQLTNYGISGICVFNLSRYVSDGLSQNKKEEIIIDFVPELSKKELEEYIIKYSYLDITNILEKLINKKLVKIILSKSNNNVNNIIDNIKNFKVEIINTKDFNTSQTCIGGLSLDEVTPNFELKKYPNLYVIGEVLDIDGDCGGYNIMFSTYSAIKCTNYIKEKNND